MAQPFDEGHRLQRHARGDANKRAESHGDSGGEVNLVITTGGCICAVVRLCAASLARWVLVAQFLGKRNESSGSCEAWSKSGLWKDSYDVVIVDVVCRKKWWVQFRDYMSRRYGDGRLQSEIGISWSNLTAQPARAASGRVFLAPREGVERFA